LSTPSRLADDGGRRIASGEVADIERAATLQERSSGLFDLIGRGP
jgi:hypothetical protein